MEFTEMMRNIFYLLQGGGKLEFGAYCDHIQLTEWCVPIDRNLGTMHFTGFHGQDCKRDLYFSAYSEVWLDEFEQWIKNHFALDELEEGDPDTGEGTEEWVFTFEGTDVPGEVEFYHYVI